MLFRSSDWNSDNEFPRDISNSDNNSDSSEASFKTSEIESDLDENGVLEVCFCNEAFDSRIDEDDLEFVYIGIDQADSLCVNLNELIKRGKIQKDRIF